MSGNRFGDFTYAPAGIDALFNKELRVENDANGNPIYVGYAKPGSATSDAVWQIKKYTYDGNDSVTRAQLANDSVMFSFVWDDRTTYF